MNGIGPSAMPVQEGKVHINYEKPTLPRGAAMKPRKQTLPLIPTIREFHSFLS